MPAPAAPRPTRPLAEVPAERWHAVDGVLTDIDDTLTCRGDIGPEAARALGALATAAIPVIAVTGRPALWSQPLLRRWPLTAIVAENGGVLLRPQGAGVRLDHAQDAETRRAHRRRLDACAAAVLREVPGCALARDSGQRLTDIAIDHGEHARLDAAAVGAVLDVMRRHGLQASVSSIHVNGWLGGHTKWSGACWAVREALGRELDPARWLFVGDSANDEVMFERVGLTVGVANIAFCIAALRTPPAYVTTHERGRGFAEVADALLRARQPSARPASGTGE
jgi:HAD superfamily hydrolase (TIGR01484 family)